jgi:hypothetical protein
VLVILYYRVDTTDARIRSFSSGILILKILKGFITISFILAQSGILSDQ